MAGERRERYVVRGRVAEAPGVVTLALRLADGSVPPFSPGQFIVVYFPETGTPEGKAYSVSSAPHEGSLRLSVRGIGEFSNRLCALRVGDTVEASLPSGYFGSESETSGLVLLAAGIGVAPLRSIAVAAARGNPARPIRLLQSARTARDLIFRETFDGLAVSGANFRATCFVTREADVPPGVVRGRMDAAAARSAAAGIPDPEFLICGSVSFVRDMWRGLRAAGVPEDSVLTEAFFSH